VPFVFHDPFSKGVDLDDDVVHVFAAVSGCAWNWTGSAAAATA
jgi:hypothetical protein